MRRLEFHMDLTQRIAQFENMAQADPTNEMAHFSLAQAYVQSGRFGDAAASFVRCTELVPDMSKAYQLAGDALIRAGQRDQAAQVLLRGYVVAAERGDRMPQKAIEDLLRSIGRHVPKVADAPGRGGGTGPAGHADAGSAGANGAASGGTPSPSSNLAVGEAGGMSGVGNGGEGGFVCSRTGRPGTRMAKPPMRGPVGAWIQANISAETWDAWIRQGTKVINELRLDLSRDRDSETYDQHMYEYLGLDDETLERMKGRSSTGA